MSEGNSGYTRRRLIQTGTAGAVAAGLGTAGSADAKKRRHPRKADVIVVGAGYAGLTAAYRLAQKGKSVIVLEARNRVGGPTQDRVLALMKETGVKRFSTYDTGDNVYHAGGMNERFSDTSPFGSAPPDPTTAADVALVVERLDMMSTSVPPDAPWTAQNADDWDAQTLYSWVKQNSSGSQRFMNLVQIATEPIFGAEARDISLLFTLFHIAASGNEKNPGTFERNFNTRNGGQQWRCHGGTQLISLRVAKQLGHRRIFQHTPARRIVQYR